MIKKFYCYLCKQPVEKNFRLIYQKYNGVKPYGVFKNKKNFDLCEVCFSKFVKFMKGERAKNGRIK